ncbi:hypothetical protein DYB37_005585 [Aphanomyces astaci]|uniref:ABC transmembrane type-1 domain-containing protein n=1 Tax=Aphanomyces astaci TaxID=112090 RepID=A0A3R6YAA8_APHAT|nr:hypothetical protein DYB37_005585 [Aphanomyces astaci]
MDIPTYYTWIGRKRFWEEEAHVIEQEVPTRLGHLSLSSYESLVSPSLRSPYGMLQEEPPRFVMDEVLTSSQCRRLVVFHCHILFVLQFQGPAFPDDTSEHTFVQDAFRGYLRAAGVCLVVVVVLVQCMWQVLQLGSDLWLSHWCTTSSLHLWSNNSMYTNGTIVLSTHRNVSNVTKVLLHDDTIVVTEAMVMAYSNWNMNVYVVLAGVGTVMVVVRTLLTSCAGMRASNVLFNGMTNTVVNAPLADLSPDRVSRILGVYNADMATVDTRLPFSLGGFVANVFISVFCLGACIVCLRWSGIVLILWGGMYVYFGSHFARPAQEVERLANATRAPHVTFVHQSVAGAVVIRAFGLKQVRRFHRLHQTHVDVHHRASYAHQVLAHWFALRMQLLHACLIASIAVAAAALVSTTDGLSPGLFGLVFNYALLVPPHLEFVFTIWSGVLSSLAGVHRVLEYVHGRQSKYISYV